LPLSPAESFTTAGAALVAGLLTYIVCSAAGLRAWRALVHAASTAPVSVVS
jgi:hypothetical protein